MVSTSRVYRRLTEVPGVVNGMEKVVLIFFFIEKASENKKRKIYNIYKNDRKLNLLLLSQFT